MMLNNNTIGAVGNLVADPELRFSAAGKAWTSARLAVKPFVPGENDPETIFVNLVMFGSLAENVAEQLRKGDRIAVTGRLEDDNWTGKDGIERPGQKIVVDGLGPDLRFNAKPSRDHFGLPILNDSDMNDEPF